MMRLTCKSFTASACDQLNYSDRLFLRFCEVQVTTLWFMEETAFNHFQFRAPESILRWFMSTIFEKITWSHPLRFPEMNSLKRSFNNLSLTFQSSAGLVIDSNSSASRPFYEGFVTVRTWTPVISVLNEWNFLRMNQESRNQNITFRSWLDDSH